MAKQKKTDKKNKSKSKDKKGAKGKLHRAFACFMGQSEIPTVVTETLEGALAQRLAGEVVYGLHYYIVGEAH